MSSSLLDMSEVNYLLRAHFFVAVACIIGVAVLFDPSEVISVTLSYGLFLLTWILSAFYAFRFRGAQRIKAILLGFYVGSFLRFILTLTVIMALISYWPKQWLKLNWLAFLSVMLLASVTSGFASLIFYRTKNCG